MAKFLIAAIQVNLGATSRAAPFFSQLGCFCIDTVLYHFFCSITGLWPALEFLLLIFFFTVETRKKSLWIMHLFTKVTVNQANFSAEKFHLLKFRRNIFLSLA